MLATSRRLRAAEVREIITSGRAIRGGVLLSARFYATPEPLRAAAVVPKKLAKTAVMRNKLRRAIYRALGGAKRYPHGRFVFFLRGIPSSPLAPALREEIEGILKNVR